MKATPVDRKLRVTPCTMVQTTKAPMVATADTRFKSPANIFACSVCGRTGIVMTARNMLASHGPSSKRCPGSKAPPLLVGSSTGNQKQPCTVCGKPISGYEDLSGKPHCYEHFFAAVAKTVSESKVPHAIKPCPFCESKDSQIIEAAGVAYVICKTCGANGPHCATKGGSHTKWNDRSPALI